MGGWDATKCKVNLKLSLNRMKIQKNKKTNIIKHSRKSIADLLREGKDEVARVKVEAIIREELQLQAFEIMELFIELLQARINMLKMQKGVPFDLKESVCTVIYAAPRMEVKELMVVRKLLIDKYGKSFASEAMENRGNCVNAKVISKLSVNTPEDGEVFTYLEGIAKEHKVDWVSPFSNHTTAMFSTPSGLSDPLQPSVMSAFPATPSHIPQHTNQFNAPTPVLPGASYMAQQPPQQQPNLAASFPSVPGASGVPPPTYQQSTSFQSQHQQYSPTPPQGYPNAQFNLPSPPSSAYNNNNNINNNSVNMPSPPGAHNNGSNVPEIDDLMARFNNLKDGM